MCVFLGMRVVWGVFKRKIRFKFVLLDKTPSLPNLEDSVKTTKIKGFCRRNVHC